MKTSFRIDADSCPVSTAYETVSAAPTPVHTA